jgi:putative OPT family oligopeptide transporter
MSISSEITHPMPVTIAAETGRELSLRAIATGTILGVIFGIANLYLTLKLSISVSASIPVAVLGIAAFTFSRHVFGSAAGTRFEFATVQTIGSVGESLSFAVGLAIPVFGLLNLPLAPWQVFLATCGGGLVGCLALVPSRRAVLDAVFPEGTACASVIKAATTRARTVIQPLLQGATVAAGYALLRPFTSLATQSLDLDLSPELLGVGYWIETRAAITLGCGGISAWVLLYAKGTHFQIAPDSFNFLAAGAIATAALIQVVKYWKRSPPRASSIPGIDTTARDLRSTFVWAAALASLSLAFGAVAVPLDLPRASLGTLFVLTAVLVVIFVRFSARVAGQIGSSANPISAMALISAITAAAAALLLSGQTQKEAAVLSVTLIVAMTATCAGMTAQVLKTSEILGATPRRQEIGVIIGTITSSAGLTLCLPFFHDWSAKPGPSTLLLRDMIVSSTANKIEWDFVVAGAVVTILLHLMGVSSFIFAVGMYLKARTALPIAAGGLVYWATEQRVSKCPEDRREEARRTFSLFASGVIAGGVILGLVASVLTHGLDLGDSDSILTLLVFIALGVLFLGAGRVNPPESS